MALYIVCGLVGLVALLLLVALFRALAAGRPAPVGSPPAVDEQRAMGYARHLARMVQCATVNAPSVAAGEVQKEFDKLRAVLQEQYPLCFAKLTQVPLPDALLLRWPGRDAGRDAVLLLAHSDVVPAPGAWARPPFGGEIADGCVWGRGAMDTKDSLCALFEATEALLAEGFVPACDVWLGSSHNEETMGPGAVHIKEYFAQSGVKLAFVLDEGGSVIEAPLPGLAGKFAMVGLVEKGYANVKFTAKSNGGHASTPPKNSPLARLAAFVNEVERHPPFESRIEGPMRQMLSTLAPHMPFKWRFLLCNLWLFGPLVKAALPKLNAQAAAMLRTTCAFTMASGSPAANVLPNEASVTANLRFSLHQPMAPSLAVLDKLAQKHGLAMQVLYADDVHPAVDTTGTPWQHVKSCVERAFPEAVCTPYTVLFGTDSRHFAQSCRCVVRFSPFLLSAKQLAGMHGLDENIGVESLARAVDFYTLLLREYA